MADHLSECILVQVLKRLPVKPLFRCTAVEKSWYRLIKSPYFKTLYSSYHQKNDKNKYLLFYAHNPPRFSLRHDDEQSKEYSPQLQFPIQEKRLQVYGISNGLICLSTRLDIQDLRKSIYLWNPVIRKSKTLPDSPLPSRDQLLQIRYCCSTAGLAFGYFANMDDYRVVLFVTYHSLEGDDSRPDLFYVYVYSLTTNSWKTIDNLSEVPCYKISSSVVIDGSVYWLGEYCNLIAIVCFEVENEIIRNLNL
ncbi:F-box domain-containing protein [Heracleum sosnowskyi]|uniref:F-box domain-containing protein n=1 Tax=Heracleum sosnowskyi TaxID=360622 RepID=A0AAD8I0H8_9APIA|nr:F-box domain-containing protein [Heracleum sosnowskyi]